MDEKRYEKPERKTKNNKISVKNAKEIYHRNFKA
jgi:hypothetical protein